jgi:ABC-type tungstate transport system substrate-binding protein
MTHLNKLDCMVQVKGPPTAAIGLLIMRLLGTVSPGGDVDGDALLYTIQGLISYKKPSASFLIHT